MKAIFKNKADAPKPETDEPEGEAETSIRRCAIGAAKIILHALEAADKIGNVQPTPEQTAAYSDEIQAMLERAGLDSGECGIAAIIADGLSDEFGHQELTALHRLKKLRERLRKEG